MAKEKKETRNRLKRGDIQDRVLEGITKVQGLTDAQISALTALVKAEMKVGTTSETYPPKDVDGVLHYYCSRTKHYFPIEDMITTKEGESKGYSKVSQEKLTEVNARIKELNAKAMDALNDGETDTAMQFGHESKALMTAKESGEIYADLA